MLCNLHARGFLSAKRDTYNVLRFDKASKHHKQVNDLHLQPFHQDTFDQSILSMKPPYRDYAITAQPIKLYFFVNKFGKLKFGLNSTLLNISFKSAFFLQRQTIAGCIGNIETE